MNMPLSKAYNEVLNKPNSKCDYFVIFDDDTQIPVNYFTQICIYDKLYGKLFKVPIVQQNGKIVSPIKANHKKLDFVGPGLLAGNDFSFVGSGMIIPYNFLEINKFDEAFNFYGIDHDISQTYLRDNVINIIPVILNHSLSTDFCDNKFPKFKVESLLFSTIYNGYKHGRKLSSSIRALKYCFRFIIRCKNIGYLTSFIRNYIFVYFVHKR